MEATTTPSSDLLRARAAHMDNLQRMRHQIYSLNAKDAARAEATMANLMQQVYAIDAQLGAAKGPRKVWGAA
jgi:hypothetical protein